MVVNVPPGKLGEKTIERLQDYSRVVILGNQSIVSIDAEKALMASKSSASREKIFA